ncbi:MAG TPA: putative glycolipid-binding domain-containing protein [Streptosporangiaceae bacterium]|nr:putative glycolipid-binding domain-containing protein [Streptosporangiaceae bacterium]
MVAITWVKPSGAEYASVALAYGKLVASGMAIGADPLPYHMDYSLTCDDGYITRQLRVHAAGDGWDRAIDLSRDPDGAPGQKGGAWRLTADASGIVDLPPPGGEPETFAGALDCDLGLSPLTNTMPVLRHGLMHGGDPVTFLMAWVSVPDLSVRASRQRYTYLRPGVVNYASGSFSEDIVFDGDGLVLDYPSIGKRA